MKKKIKDIIIMISIIIYNYSNKYIIYKGEILKKCSSYLKVFNFIKIIKSNS